MATPKSTSGGGIGQPSLPGPASPADPGNINAPANPNPQQPNVIQTDSATGIQFITVVVGGKLIQIPLNTQLSGDTVLEGYTGNPFQDALAGQRHAGPPLKSQQPTKPLLSDALPAGLNKTSGTPFASAGVTVLDKINSISEWYKNAGTRQQIINQMYQAGLITSKKAPSIEEVTMAWGLLVQEAALQSKGTGTLGQISPEELLAKAAQGGWNSLSPNLSPVDAGARGTGNINNSTETSSQSQTTYLSYVDPATAMGALADAYYRLMGRNPTSTEYQAFLEGVLKPYQEAANTGKFETKTTGPNTGQTTDPTTGLPVDSSGTTSGTSTQTNVVSQRGVGTRGVEFLASQQALATPESANYQAATTVFGSILKALGSPGAGLTTSGPTTTTP